MDSNHRNPKMTDLQSVPFNHSGTYPLNAVSAKNNIYYTDETNICQYFFMSIWVIFLCIMVGCSSGSFAVFFFVVL